MYSDISPNMHPKFLTLRAYKSLCEIYIKSLQKPM